MAEACEVTGFGDQGVGDRLLRRLGRKELAPYSQWKDGRPETELNFKLYRQATNKIAGISEGTAAFLEDHFR
ncbi:MAG TPA: hypothetical protein VML92_06715 [Steroidobacteraceae bacterium]|nr:hypothetical protein [Steroidobacteraceae bacterium]